MSQSSARAAYLVMTAHAADWCRGCRACEKCLRSAGGASPAQTEIIPARLKRTKRCKPWGNSFRDGNLQTKLARFCGGAICLWLGYPGRNRWVRAARQSTAITSAAMRPLGSRRQSPVAGDQSPLAGGHQALNIDVWATYPAVEVHADTLAV